MKRSALWLVVMGIVVAGIGWWNSGAQPGPEPSMQGSTVATAGAIPDASVVAPGAPGEPPAAEPAGAAPEASATTPAPRSASADAARADFRRELQRDWACSDWAESDAGKDDWALGLPPEQIERAQADRAAALEWARRSCGSDTDDRRELALKDAVSAALRAGDPWARLASIAAREQAKLPDAAQVDELRQALQAVLPQALAEPDPLSFAMIDLAIDRARRHLGRQVGTSDHMIWPLVACDLGADCGRDSPFMRGLCLQRGLCGYPDAASALRDGLWPQAWAEMYEQQRQDLLARLRAGGAGVFAAPPPPPGG